MKVTDFAVEEFSDKSEWKRAAVYDAQSYQKYVDELMGPFAEMVPKKFDPEKFIKVGEHMRFAYRDMPTPSGLSHIHHKHGRGLALFNGEVSIPILYEGSTDGTTRTWMSITPQEVVTCLEALPFAKGHVIIGGMGLGFLARKVLDLPHVTKVTVVDLNNDVLETFGRPIVEKYGPERVRLAHADFYTWCDCTNEFDSCLVDIWPGIGDSFEDKKYRKLKKKLEQAGVPVWAWTYHAYRHWRFWI